MRDFNTLSIAYVEGKKSFNKTPKNYAILLKKLKT